MPAFAGMTVTLRAVARHSRAGGNLFTVYGIRLPISDVYLKQDITDALTLSELNKKLYLARNISIKLSSTIFHFLNQNLDLLDHRG
ncbi:MAG TPA: hypothetical protein VK787_07955 [Puia sp.]|jgi:hypothetical protein|nr:hypothetical protein [Puia sp.]